MLKSPMLYRYVNNICYCEVEPWDAQNADEFDQARKGSSALFAATQRCLVTEVAVALGLFAACALHDYEQFFDSIEILDWLKEVVECEYRLAPSY